MSPNACKTCGKKFGCKESIQAGEKPFACKECDKKFGKGESTDAGEKPYACKTCDKGFSCEEILRCNKCGDTTKWEGPERTHEGPLEVAETFNKWFKEKIEVLIQKIDKSALEDPFKRLKERMRQRKLNFSLTPVGVEDVINVLKKLTPKKSCGVDGISSELLKMCKEELAGPLTIIINRSICSGIFPKEWKIAKITPLLKKGDPCLLKNYRPVALLCVAGMVLEKIVADQIEEFFEKNGLFGEFQYGFRRNKSTISELLALFETIQEAKEQDMKVALILYDLSAAFDSVEPEVIIEKLRIYGFDRMSRDWMRSYLTERRQFTRIEGKDSSSVTLRFGTPQGSRLSPLLFVILMADLDLWTNDSKLSNFADDTQSVIIKPTEEELRSTTVQESRAVVGYFSANNLVNNKDKAALLYNNRRRAESIMMEIAGENITAKDSEKLLGIHVSSSMDWKTHISKLQIKLHQRLGLLRRLKNKVPNSKLKIIAEAIFTSVARYGIAVYFKPRLHSDPTCEDQTKLQVIQNKMLRLLAGKKPADKVRVEDISKKFGVMSMNQMASYHVIMETYNVMTFGSSEKIREKLTPASNHSRSLTVPLCKKSSCRSFSYFASRLCNTLPAHLKSIVMAKETITDKSELNKRQNLFKRDIKKWILEGGVPFR